MGTEVTSDAVQYGEGETLKWNGHAIRVLPVNGVLWFALPDLCDALCFRSGAAATVDKPSFPGWSKMVCAEDPTDEGKGKPRDVVILSPVGVWLFTCLTDPGRGQNLAAWAKREAAARDPVLPSDDRTMTLRLAQDGSLPPYPMPWSGWKRAWINLRESREYLTGPKAWQGGSSDRNARSARVIDRARRDVIGKPGDGVARSGHPANPVPSVPRDNRPLGLKACPVA